MLALLFAPVAARAQAVAPPPPAVNWTPIVGTQLPMDSQWRDESDKPVRPADLQDHKPALVLLGYNECPMLCTVELNGLIDALKKSRATPGRDFQIFFMDISPTESAALVRAKRANYARELGKGGTAAWHFLRSDKDTIAHFAKSAGYTFAKGKDGTYAHPSGVLVVDPQGRIAAFQGGIQFNTHQIDLALEGRQPPKTQDPSAGSGILAAILRCCPYDPHLGLHTASIRMTMKVASFLGLCLAGFWIYRQLRR